MLFRLPSRNTFISYAPEKRNDEKPTAMLTSLLAIFEPKSGGGKCYYAMELIPVAAGDASRVNSNYLRLS